MSLSIKETRLIITWIYRVHYDLQWGPSNGMIFIANRLTTGLKFRLIYHFSRTRSWSRLRITWRRYFLFLSIPSFILILSFLVLVSINATLNVSSSFDPHQIHPAQDNQWMSSSLLHCSWKEPFLKFLGNVKLFNIFYQYVIFLQWIVEWINVTVILRSLLLYVFWLYSKYLHGFLTFLDSIANNCLFA